MTADRTALPTSPRRPSRRAVATGVAWAVPTVVVTGVAPALASSQTCTACGTPVGSADGSGRVVVDPVQNNRADAQIQGHLNVTFHSCRFTSGTAQVTGISLTMGGPQAIDPATGSATRSVQPYSEVQDITPDTTFQLPGLYMLSLYWPDGEYGTASAPRYPTRLCYTLSIVVGDTTCTQSVCFELAIAGRSGSVVDGTSTSTVDVTGEWVAI